MGTLERVDEAAFNVDSFYFNLTGSPQSGQSENTMTVTGYSGATVVSSFMISLLDLISGIASDYGITVAFYEDSTGAACKDDDNTDFDKTLQICKNKGYTVALNGLLDDVTSVSWTASPTAQLRIDTIGVSEVPLPAGVLLLATGLFGLGVVRKRAA